MVPPKAKEAMGVASSVRVAPMVFRVYCGKFRVTHVNSGMFWNVLLRNLFHYLMGFVAYEMVDISAGRQIGN